jgi:ribose 5-phosphate isomerase B
MMKIGIAADHAGLGYLKILYNELVAQGYRVLDLVGDNVYDDYPDVARLMSQAIMHKTIDRGILICGSGVGVSIAANKYPGVRAAICHDMYSAHQGVEHDRMNVLCLGERVIGPELAKEISMKFLEASYLEREKYARRFEKMESIENENFSQLVIELK